jgi:thymidylate synthase (FAD)
MKIIPQGVNLEWVTPKPVRVIEKAGRNCYLSEDKITPDSAPKFVKMICKKNHESVLEHASASFRIVTDRGVLAEITRHRLSSFSVESTRYLSYAKGKFNSELTVIEPPGLSGVSRDYWLNSVLFAEMGYMELIRQGVTPEIARAVLPMCLKTELTMTSNFRQWKNVLRLRLGKAAHPQIREIASLIQAELIRLCPEVFGD